MRKSASFLDIKYLGSELNKVNQHSQSHFTTFTLSWNNHIDLIMKNLSNACYIIRNAKTYMSFTSLKVIYYALFSLGYELWNYILGKLVALLHKF